jgi:hypothetical protein
VFFQGLTSKAGTFSIRALRNNGFWLLGKNAKARELSGTGHSLFTVSVRKVYAPLTIA